jgi:hypothetical protein
MPRKRGYLPLQYFVFMARYVDSPFDIRRYRHNAAHVSLFLSYSRFQTTAAFAESFLTWLAEFRFTASGSDLIRRRFCIVKHYFSKKVEIISKSLWITCLPKFGGKPVPKQDRYPILFARLFQANNKSNKTQ